MSPCILKSCAGTILIAACLLLLPFFVHGQAKLDYYSGADCVMNTIADIEAGCTATNYFTVQYSKFDNNTTYPPGWTLKVRANGAFTNGSATIAPQYVSIAFNSANGGPGGVSGTGFQPLSTSLDRSLITTALSLQTPPVYYFEHRLDVRIQGGSHLAVGAGTYRTTLTLTLADQNGVVIASDNRVQISFTVNYSSTCAGAALDSYFNQQYVFSSYAQQMAGATVTDALTIQYSPHAATCTGWSLKVRAAGNFTNGANSVSPQFFSLRFNRVSYGPPSAAAIGVNANPVTLSTSDAFLINHSNAAFVASTATEHKFDMIIQGGNQLIVPNGVYNCSLIFTLLNQANQVVSTTTVNAYFAVNSSVNSYSLVFQNNADQVDMAFNTPGDYMNGVSVTKTRGIRITGYQPYQVIVKTSTSSLSSATTQNTIPVSAISLETVKNTTTSGGINTYTRALSMADQIIITNPLADYTQQVVEYNLRYYTQPGDSRLAIRGGLYRTVVFFVVVPQ